MSDDSGPETPANSPAVSRRTFLVGGGAGAVGLAALAGGVGYALGDSGGSDSEAVASTTTVATTTAPPTTTTTAPPTTTATAAAVTGPYRSEPTLIPPVLQVTNLGAPEDEGYLMLTPSLLPTIRGVTSAQQIAEGKGQTGLMIVDTRGELVWFDPTDQLATNLQVQQYRGNPVLAYWKGAIGVGIGYGEAYLLDDSYQPVGVIAAGNGLKVDLHELTLTAQGTALVTAYKGVTTDLTAVGGPSSAPAQAGVVQEIDVATGKLLFEWNSLDHVTVDETYATYAKGTGLDYFHINSVAQWDATSILISARNTCAIYRIDRNTGEIIWRLNGKKSDFAMGAGTPFWWQHHARLLPTGEVSLFDDGAMPTEEPETRGLVLSVDEAAKTVSLVRAYTHPAHLLAQFEGSLQILPNGHAIMGYGGEPYTSEFDQAGNLLLDARFPTGVQSYRGFRYPWTGRPTTQPKVVVETDETGGTAVYVSWNGATEVAGWRVSTGASQSSLAVSATVPRAGFETAITVHPTGNLLQVDALDRSGAVLGTSDVLAVPPA